MTSEREYRKEYEALGDERVQEKPANGFPPYQAAARRRAKRTDAQAQELTEYELFWMFRKDLRWLQVPGVMRFVSTTSGPPNPLTRHYGLTSFRTLNTQTGKTAVRARTSLFPTLTRF